VETLEACRYPATADAVFIGAGQYRRHSYGSNHPLGIPRVSLTFDLINAYGAFAPGEYVVGRVATKKELGWFHTEDYINALQRCEALGGVRDVYRQRHHIGTLENPYFPNFFRTPALATGSSIVGAEQVLRGRRAFSPAGGMHHALPDRAQGFCFFNDPVLAILRLRQEGRRVLYVDIDAHHGDGVEFAFHDDPDVFTFSLHMDTGYAYPFKGGSIADQGGAHGEHACLNAPLPVGTNDAEYGLVFDTLWPVVLAQFAPDVVVLQAGTDALFADPLGKFQLSTPGFLRVVQRIIDASPALLVLGGGGYHPLALARCWTGVWALLSGRTLPAEIPEAGRRLLRGVYWDQDEDEPYFSRLFESRLDVPTGQSVRPEIDALLSAIRDHHPLMRGL
jgi:acetoin utilization protein AcuC